MKKFSIDVKASGKKEMKEAREYLRYAGYKVKKRKDETITINYLTNHFKIECKSRKWNFEYCKVSLGEILTLPRDSNKLAEIVYADRKAMKASCDNILSKAKKSEAKVAFDNMFGNFKSDLETLLEI